MRTVIGTCHTPMPERPHVFYNNLLPRKQYLYVCANCGNQYLSDQRGEVVTCLARVPKQVSEYEYERNKWYYAPLEVQ